MKRAIRKYFRHIRYKVCRFIYYFDKCPKSYRKDFKSLFLEGLACMALCFGGVIFFSLLILLA